MNFYNYITEARKKLGIDDHSKGGSSAGQLLKSFHDEFKENEWGGHSAKHIKTKFGSDFVVLQKRLEDDGYIDKIGNKRKISQKGLDYISGSKTTVNVLPKTDDSVDVDDIPDNSDVDTNLAKGVSNIATLREKKFIVPIVGKNSKYLDQMKKILTHMDGFADGTVKTTYMLAGDPGAGKTSFIKSLSTLTGIPLVIIEAPHITQEHLINIPFLVIDGDKTENGKLTLDDTQMKVVQAESNLVTRLKQKRKRRPDQIERDINRNKVLRDLYPQLKRRIDIIQDSYNSILFLDEFYRTSSMKIRNVLRNILNGKIGNDRIPTGVYIIMATNINDDGVEQIPLNQDFHLINYDISSKDDFMSYMYGKYVNNPEDPEQQSSTGISVKPEVWNKFMGELTDKDLGFNDETNDVRLSPRRLEQMIMCIDSSLPITNEESAANLFAFIKNNLTNYIEDSSSEYLLGKFNKITKELIEELLPLGVEIDIERVVNSPVKRSDWRKQLQEEIQMKMKLGDERKYVPVVSGHPGIGKTTQMATMAEEMRMGFIQVDVSNLTTEDITGMPIANTKDKEITTKFSEANLYITIMKDYNSQIGEFRQDGRKYNMILLFDELNRASVPVFNSIRKVLLEKEFEGVDDNGKQMKLPDDIIVTGAINPTDTGTVEFTSHTRDVLDIIPSSGHFSKTFEYIKNKSNLVKISKYMGFDLHTGIANIMSTLSSEFESKEDNNGLLIDDPEVRPFWWHNGEITFYVSPREMTECVSNATIQVKAALLDMNFDSEQEYTEDQYSEFIDEIINVTAKSFVDTFNMITTKQEIQGFSDILGMKIVGNDKFKKFFDTIKSLKQDSTSSLYEMLQDVDGDINYFEEDIIGQYIKTASSTEMLQDVTKICEQFLQNDIHLAIEKMLELYIVLSTSLNKVNASNQYENQLKKYISGYVVSIMKSDTVDIFDIAENEKIIKIMEKMI